MGKPMRRAAVSGVGETSAGSNEHGPAGDHGNHGCSVRAAAGNSHEDTERLNLPPPDAAASVSFFALQHA